MYILMKCLSFLLCHLPLSWSHAFGRWLGHFFWAFVPKKRKLLAQRQILDCAITDDPDEAMAIGKASALRFGPMIVEVLLFPRYRGREKLREIVEIRGREYLDPLIENPAGGVFMASHAGNWELLGAVMATEGLRLISVAQEQNNAGADRFINEYRQMQKQHVTYKTGIRDMIRFLRDGYYIGLLMDQDPGYAGIMVKLFGKDTLTADGPAKFAVLGNYPVVPVFIHEDRPYHHCIEVLPPVYPFACDKEYTKEEKKERTYSLTQELNLILENRIRTYPEDWFWLHNRWKWTDRYKAKKAGKNVKENSI